jgi:hypothetical protein
VKAQAVSNGGWNLRGAHRRDVLFLAEERTESTVLTSANGHVVTSNDGYYDALVLLNWDSGEVLIPETREDFDQILGVWSNLNPALSFDHRFDKEEKAQLLLVDKGSLGFERYGEPFITESSFNHQSEETDDDDDFYWDDDDEEEWGTSTV